MNRITRLLAIAGLGVGAAIALAGPAQAATSDVSHSTTAATKAHRGNDDRIVGFFDSRGTCERVGRVGEISDRWDDYDCYRVSFHGGDWALSVSEDDNWGGGFHHGGPFGGGFHHGGPFGGPFGGPHGGPFGGPHGGPFGGPFGGPHGGPFGGPFGGPHLGPNVGR
jgi:hypothetical protein